MRLSQKRLGGSGRIGGDHFGVLEIGHGGLGDVYNASDNRVDLVSVMDSPLGRHKFGERENGEIRNTKGRPWSTRARNSLNLWLLSPPRSKTYDIDRAQNEKPKCPKTPCAM